MSLLCTLCIYVLSPHLLCGVSGTYTFGTCIIHSFNQPSCKPTACCLCCLGRSVKAKDISCVLCGEPGRSGASGGINSLIRFCSDPETFTGRRTAQRKRWFLFTPAGQPDCSSDPERTSRFWSVDCWLELEGKWTLPHKHNITQSRERTRIRTRVSSWSDCLGRMNTHDPAVRLSSLVMNTPWNKHSSGWNSDSDEACEAFFTGCFVSFCSLLPLSDSLPLVKLAHLKLR